MPVFGGYWSRKRPGASMPARNTRDPIPCGVQLGSLLPPLQVPSPIGSEGLSAGRWYSRHSAFGFDLSYASRGFGFFGSSQGWGARAASPDMSQHVMW